MKYGWSVRRRRRRSLALPKAAKPFMVVGLARVRPLTSLLVVEGMARPVHRRHIAGHASVHPACLCKQVWLGWAVVAMLWAACAIHSASGRQRPRLNPAARSLDISTSTTTMMASPTATAMQTAKAMATATAMVLVVATIPPCMQASIR